MCAYVFVPPDKRTTISSRFCGAQHICIARERLDIKCICICSFQRNGGYASPGCHGLCFIYIEEELVHFFVLGIRAADQG